MTAILQYGKSDIVGRRVGQRNDSCARHAVSVGPEPGGTATKDEGGVDVFPYSHPQLSLGNSTPDTGVARPVPAKDDEVALQR